MKDDRISFNAIDYETATGKRNSACAVSIVTVVKAEIVNIWTSYIKPPNNYYSQLNIDLHGITPKKTENADPFYKVYPHIKNIINGKPIVAHNSSFDQSVMKSCMEMSKISISDLNLTPKWYCTNKLYKLTGHKPTKLNNLCEKYNIPLIHHDPTSDAEACAKLFILYLQTHVK